MSHSCMFCVHRCFCHFCTFFGLVSFASIFLLIGSFLIVQMSITPYVGFTDGASRSTNNLPSATWVIYNPNGELIDLQGICLRRAKTNVVEYSVVIELLTKATSLNIHAFIVNLDS